MSDALNCGAGERRLPRQHLVEYAPEGVEIASPVYVPVSRSLLRAHVRRRPERKSRVGESVGSGGAHCSRDAEVRHQRVAALEQDVLRFDIAMDHPMSVRVAQGVRYLAGDAERVVEGELLLALQPVAQRFPFYEGHDVIQESAGRLRRTPGVIQRQDMRMVQVGGGRDLAQKALGPRAWTSPGSP